MAGEVGGTEPVLRAARLQGEGTPTRRLGAVYQGAPPPPAPPTPSCFCFFFFAGKARGRRPAVPSVPHAGAGRLPVAAAWVGVVGENVGAVQRTATTEARVRA